MSVTEYGEPFESLELPHKEVPHLMGVRYRVYSDATNYQQIEAANALEALQKSGLSNPVRIERDTIFLHRIIDLSVMMSGKAVDMVTPALPDAGGAPTAAADAADKEGEAVLPADPAVSSPTISS